MWPPCWCYTFYNKKLPSQNILTCKDL